MATPLSRRTTINDVAASAGVSRGTVSRVLNEEAYVSAEAREAVMLAIQKTGYQVNQQARHLRQARTCTVALLLTEPSRWLFADPLIEIIVEAIATELSSRDISLVLLLASEDGDRKRAQNFILSGQVDGVLTVFPNDEDRALLHELAERRIPQVITGGPTGLREVVTGVQLDDRAGAMMVLEHLRELGRRKIGHLTGWLRVKAGTERLSYYQEFLGEDYDPDLVEEGEFLLESGRYAMERLLDRVPDLDAVFAANDRMAEGAIEVIRQRGLRVPEDIAVVGYDNHGASPEMQRFITTAGTDLATVGSAMVKVLEDLLAGGTVHEELIPVQLHVRGSTVPDPAVLAGAP